MPTLLVGYDLNAPGQDYADLIESIKASGRWWHHLDSTWLVSTSLTAAQMRDRLAAYLDADDELLVLDVTGDIWSAKGFADRAYEWMHENL